MFQSFVIGPVAIGRFGLARRCIECRAYRVGPAPECSGFGAGCLAGPPREREEPRGFAWAPLIDPDLRLRGF